MFVVGAYVLTTLPDDSPIPNTTGPFLAIIVGLPLVAHLAVRRLAPQADGMLLPLASLLNGLGYVHRPHRRGQGQGRARRPAVDLDDPRRRRLHRHA